MKLFQLLMLMGLVSLLNAQPAGKLSAALERISNETYVDSDLTVWVYFTDKGQNTSLALAKLKDDLTPNGLKRRLRNRPKDRVVDHYDLPVYPAYLQAVTSFSVRYRHKSRWLNAVSVDILPEDLYSLERLPFVEKIDVVRSYKIPEVSVAETSKGLSRSTELHRLSYGASEQQNAQINVIGMHDMGYDGGGVIIAMLDAGFDNLEHESLTHLNITHTWDFVNNDANVEDEPGQAGRGYHGTYTLSAMAGYQEGALVGPAYGATFLLAKTENTDWEHNVEEDDWVAGAEWADSLGADIISSSLGYSDFDAGEPISYTWEEMDGMTTVVTIGAEIAATRGILVVNSAGNSGSIPEPANTLVAPSDGKHVLAVGAVNASGALANFSSRGPTADGRIKPDVLAQGVATVCASASSLNGYLAVNGTSLSCPLVAGAAALLLQANPSLTNLQIMEGLRNTGSNNADPDRDKGWGIIDVLAASSLLSTLYESVNLPEQITLYPAYPNPFNPTTTISYALPKSGEINLSVYNLLGQRVAVLFEGFQLRGEFNLVWQAENLPAGVYFISLSSGRNRKVQKAVLVK